MRLTNSNTSYRNISKTDLFHFLESVDDLSSGNPRFQRGNDLGFDVWDQFSDGFRRERGLHQLPDTSVVFSLVEEQC